LSVISKETITLPRAMDLCPTDRQRSQRLLARLDDLERQSSRDVDGEWEARCCQGARQRMHVEDSQLYNDVVRQPAITRTCRVVRSQTLPYFYSSNEFKMPLGYHAFPLFRWLTAIGVCNRRRANIVLQMCDHSHIFHRLGRPRRILTDDDQELPKQFRRQYRGCTMGLIVTLGAVSAIDGSKGKSWWEAKLITSDS